MSRSYSVLSQSPRTGLCVTVSALAIAAAGLPAQAASFTAGTEQQFRDALTAAAASLDAQSTITLTSGFAVTAPIALPGKQILVDAAGFTVTGLTFNGSSGSFVATGGGVLPLVGSSTAAQFSANGGEVRLESGAKLTASGTAFVSSGGTLIVDGVGSVLTANSLEAANGGAATIRIRNGGVVHALTTAAIGLAPNNALDLTVSGAGSKLIFDQGASVGSTGAGSNATWTISDQGAATVAQGLIVGSQTTAQPTAPQITVTGNGSTLGLGSLTLFRGEVSALNGGVITTGGLSVGPRLNNGSATVLVSDAGSRLVANGAVTLGVSPGQGVVTLARGGVLEARGAFTAGTATAVGVLNIGGGEGAAAAAAGVLDTTTVTLGAAGRLNFNHTETDYEFAPTIAGAGTIKLAAGATRLTGDSSAFTGATNLAGGWLTVDGKLGGNLTVGAGTTLGGSGTVGGDVTVTGGSIAPGNSPGVLTIAGDLTLDPASTLEVEFGESNVVGGPMNDLIKVGGDLRLDGTVNISVTAGGVFDAGLYRIASYGGTLDNQGLTIGAAPGGGAGISIQTVIPGQVNLVNTGGLAVNFWDGDGGGSANNSRVDGGAGTWTTAGLNWTTGTGAVNTAYTASDFLIFAGAPGTVNVGTVTTSGGMQFAVDGYRLSGGTITLSGGGRTFRVGDGTADGKNYVAIIDTPIVGAGGGITKTDLGTLILNGANTYTGVTNVSAGTLLINGSVAGGASALVVGANGTIGGTGTSRGGVVSGTLAPGGLTTPGTLTFNGPLTLNASSTLRYRLGQADTAGGSLNDLTVVNGNLTLNGTLNVTQSAGGSFLQGVYRLINYTGILTDNVLYVGTLPTGFTGVIQTSIANQVNLIASGAPPAGGGGGGGTTPPPPPEFTFWDGDGGAPGDGLISGGDGVWRADSGNWTTASGAQNGAFSNPRFAIFAGTAGTVRLDASGGAIEINGVQFAADGYRLTGDALNLSTGDNVIRVGDGTSAGAEFEAILDVVVAGAGGLTKADGGTLVLTGENTYGGGTRVQGGTLKIGAGGTSGSILGDVVADGAVVFDRSDDVAFSGVISGGGVLAQVGGGTLTLSADSSAFSGRAAVLAGGLVVDGALGGRISVHDGARLSGTGSVGDLTNLAGGVVAPGGDKVGVLSVRGDYYGEGGGLELQAELGGDASAADRLVVSGATHGETLVKVLRTGGQGAATVNGVRLIEVGGDSGGVFTLANPDYVIEGRRALVAGAYGYVLAKDDGGWGLRSSLPAPPTAPTKPVTPTTPEVTLYQPGVPVYEALPRVLSALSGLGTLRERTGERRWSGEAGASAWGRLEGASLHAEPKSPASLAKLDVDSWKLQFGVEKALGDGLAGGQLVAGLTAHYGEGSARVGSRFGGGDVDAKAYGVGATLTWYGASGGYVDAQGQASWFDSDLTSDLLGRRADGVGGQGYGLSLEAGRAFAAGDGLSLTPQAQLSYSSVDFDAFVDPLAAAVSSAKGDSLQARLGLALDHQRQWRDASGQTRSLRLYGVANLSYEFLDGTSARVSGVTVGGRDERLWGGMTLGGGYDFGRWSVFGEAAADTSLSGFGDSYGFSGSAGFRMRF